MLQEELNRTFAALSDPTRRQLLERLSQRSATLKELAAPLAMTQQGVSRHLQILEQAGLIHRGRQAQWRPCELRGERLQAASEWLDQYRQFWESTFDRLSDHLQHSPTRSPQEQPDA